MSTTAITPQYKELRSMLGKDEIKARFEAILKDKAPGFMASLLNTVYLNDYLKDADPNSIIVSALTAAALDLPIDNNLGFAWIIPYKVKGNKVARFQMGYKGYIQLALRSGGYRYLNVTEVYEGEKVREDRLTGNVVLNGNKISDNVIGFVGYLELLNGFRKYVYWEVNDIIVHAKKYSPSYGDERSAWGTNFDDMAKKTVIANLIKKWGIMSIQMQAAMEKDAETNGVGRVVTGDVLDQDVLDVQFQDADEPAPLVPQPDPETGEIPAEGDTDWETILVNMALASDEHSARGMVKGLGLNECDQEEGVKRARGYRGWRDMGAKSAEAFRDILKGHYPK